MYAFCASRYYFYARKIANYAHILCAEFDQNMQEYALTLKNMHEFMQTQYGYHIKGKMELNTLKMKTV